MRVGLVLGGGGAVGLAYHAGALAALEQELEWDPRSADVIVGTSAGSMVATLLRLGVSAGDLAAVAVEAHPLGMPAELEARLGTRPEFGSGSARQWILRRPRVPTIDLLWRLAKRPWTFDVAHALASVLPDGVIDINDGGTDLASVFGSEWPADDLRIVVVRRGDLRRVVFGPDLRPPAWQAVAASCAIPGFFQPITIDGTAYLDGGVRSPTNADVLAREQLDLAIVVSPMSARDLRGYGHRTIMRRHAWARLQREAATLRAHGIPTVLIEPGRDVIDAAGLNFMSDEHAPEIVRATYFDTADHLQTSEIAQALAPLTARARRRSGGAEVQLAG